MNRILLTLFTANIFYTAIAKASCIYPPENKRNRIKYMNEIKYLVQGTVENLKPERPKPYEEVTFKIVIKKVWKGDLKQKFLNVKYQWRPPFEGDRIYISGKTYNFGIGSLSQEYAQVDTNKCSPDLTDIEIKKLLKLK